MDKTLTKKIYQLIQRNETRRIKQILNAYTFEERQEIVSTNVKGSTLLFLAVKSGHSPIVNYLLDFCGANVEETGRHSILKCPPLWMAVARNFSPIVKTLLKHGADVNSVTSLNGSILSVACDLKRRKMVRTLIQNGANVNHSNFNGVSALMVSTEDNCLCKYLLSVGANVNQINNFGQHALIYAVKNKDIATVKLLLKHNADLFITDNNGDSPMTIAVREGNKEILSLLDTMGCYKDDDIARAYEISSCKLAILGNNCQASRHWKKAMKLRKLPQNTPIFQCTSSDWSPAEDLDIVISSLDAIVRQGILFLEYLLGVAHPQTLRALVNATVKCADNEKSISIMLFILGLCKCEQDPFYTECYHAIYLMISLLKHPNSLDHILKLNYAFQCLDILVAHIKYLVNSIRHFDPPKRLSKVWLMKDTLLYCLDLIKLIQPNKLSDEMNSQFKNYIHNILAYDPRHVHSATLLHLCIIQDYPIDVAKALLSCGANINCMDNKGSTPLHYALTSRTYCKDEVFHYFIESGAHIDVTNEKGCCIVNELQKKKFPITPVKYTTLQCLAARAVFRAGTPCLTDVPKHLKSFVYMHG